MPGAVAADTEDCLCAGGHLARCPIPRRWVHAVHGPVFLALLAAIGLSAGLHIALFSPGTLHYAIELALVYLLAGHYGLGMLLSAYLHLKKGEAVAALKRWPGGSPFQALYAFALIGLALAALLTIWVRGSYVLAPAIMGGVVSFGGAVVHMRSMRAAHRFVMRRDGQELLFDVVVPLTVLGLAAGYLGGT